MAYGPITETWTIAPALLAGTIYYNSYGTQLVQNYGGAVGGNGMFGGAVLSIHVGDTAPKVVGRDSDDSASAASATRSRRAARGSWSQHGDNYGEQLGLRPRPDRRDRARADPRRATWYPGIYPDGSMTLTARAACSSRCPTDTTPLAAHGPARADPDTPAFSPDGTLDRVQPPALRLTDAHRDELRQRDQRLHRRDHASSTTPAPPRLARAGRRSSPTASRSCSTTRATPGIDGAGTDPLHARGRAGADLLDQPRGPLGGDPARQPQRQGLPPQARRRRRTAGLHGGRQLASSARRSDPNSTTATTSITTTSPR